MVKFSTSIVNVLFLSVFGISLAGATSPKRTYAVDLANVMFQQDTLKKVANVDTIGDMIKSLVKYNKVRDTLHVSSVRYVPSLSLQQMLKGNIAGAYVQETTGESGTEQSIIVRGASGVLFNKKDFYALQPAIYLNGVPLAQDNTFAYDVQQYDYTRIGPANNLLSQINIDDIQSISIVKDPVELAKLGPNAVNGAIYITTKQAQSGNRIISLNSYFGYAQQPNVSTVNGSYVNAFRKPFYDKYATAENMAAYPSYLVDSTNTDYFGPSNWNDLYYQNNPSYNVNLGISGGSDRANFRFFGGATKDVPNADNTGLNKYNLNFAVNMAPFKWLTVSTKVAAIRLDRDRNQSLRDRFAEARYIPDLRTPIAPNANSYAGFLTAASNGSDLNRTTALNGNLTLAAKLNRLKLSTSFLFDYSEGARDYFVPSTLMGGASFVSTYFGYNQRLILNNAASYDFDLNSKDHELTVELGQNFQADTYKYNYTRGYNGPNDYIKIIQVLGNVYNADGSVNSQYLNAYPNFYVFRFLDKTRSNLFSVYANVAYKYKNLLDFNAILRRDGVSTGQPDSRWVTTPSVSATWHLGDQFIEKNHTVNSLDLSAGWGRVVRAFLDDRFAAGPQYRTEAGWPSEPTIPGYAAIVTSNRPYMSGYVGYGIPLPYSDRTELTLSSGLLNNRINVALTAYNRDDKRQVINVPVAQELGYTSEYQSGLAINNKGLELLVNADVLEPKGALQWNTALNFSYNRNKVAALPGGLDELIYQNNKLVVGKSVGSYWLYTNTGIYNAESEIPVNPNNGQKMTFNGIPFQAGDAKWVDYNGDYVINDKDKVVTGDRLPKLTGGWNNTFSYKNFDLNFNFIFALGQKAINQFDAARYDFINRESANNITSVREITSWQTFDDQKNYPIYNPWSSVVPYREDQDMFLEDASYAKLRSVTLGYNFRNILSKKSSIKRVYLYATGTNLFTITNFTGTDPELVNYNGMYDGTSISLPRTFVLGFKLDL